MKKYLIKKVEKNSIADEIGIIEGDFLLSINNQELSDIIDYLFLVSEEHIEMEIEKKDTKEIVLFDIEKEYDDDLGLLFENPLLDDVKRCNNDCIFCFVDQLPKGMRESLYFKDDDSRLSFMQGNFVTLTNVNYEQLDRIVKYRISPINISVHTTDPELRVKMLRNRFAGDILKKLEILAKGNISMNAQIVLIKGINDKNKLADTVNDLAKLYPYMNSIAVVPVGETKYREGLFELETFDKNSSLEVIEYIKSLQNEMLKKIGTRFVFLSDEFYAVAKAKIPKFSEYEGFVQLENGVGLIRKFKDEVLSYLKEKKVYELKGKYYIVTGVLAYDFMIELSNEIIKYNKNLSLNVIPIVNDFFGEKITVSGLLTGSDIIKKMSELPVNDGVLIPSSMLKSDEDIFLDDVSLENMNKILKHKVFKTNLDGKSFVSLLKELK